MERTDAKLRLNKNLFEMAKKKMEEMEEMEETEKEFEWKLKDTDFLLAVMLLALNQKNQKDAVYSALNHPDELGAYSTKTYAVYNGILTELKKQGGRNSSDTINTALASFITAEIGDLLSHIKPVYTIVGYKNITMQESVAEAVKNMSLPTGETELIDACCGTGALFFGLSGDQWAGVVLNDLNPLRTNFLNVLLRHPFKLIKEILKTDFDIIKKPEERKKLLREIRQITNDFKEKRKNYHKVACDVAVAAQTFLLQCLDKQRIDTEQTILKRLANFIPAHWKLLKNHARITQEDCLTYLENTVPRQKKLVLLDVPYIGTENTCGVPGYDYKKFHTKVAKYLTAANYPFLYFCRSSAPKSTAPDRKEVAEHIMKMKLGEHFLGKGLYFHKIHLEDTVTELIISNRNYCFKNQVLWENFSDDLL